MAKLEITSDEISADQLIKLALQNGAEVGDLNLSGSDLSNVGAIDTDTISVAEPAFDASESGEVVAGESGIVYAHGLPDGNTLEVTRAGLLLANGSPAPSGLDLILATLDGSGGGTKQATILSGDGSSKATEQGSPLAEYTNSSGGTQTVAVLVDNGEFNSGTGSAQDIVADAYGGAI